MSLDDPDNPLIVELKHESASAYFTACSKMVDSLQALKNFDRAAATSSLDKDQMKRRTDLLEEAGERVYFLLIQREAMKLSCSEKFLDDYEVPPEVRARLRPRRSTHEITTS